MHGHGFRWLLRHGIRCYGHLWESVTFSSAAKRSVVELSWPGFTIIMVCGDQDMNTRPSASGPNILNMKYGGGAIGLKYDVFQGIYLNFQIKLQYIGFHLDKTLQNKVKTYIFVNSTLLTIICITDDIYLIEEFGKLYVSVYVNTLINL